MKRLMILLLVIIALAGIGLYYYFDPSVAGFFPKCIFHQLTELYCPGCGAQRAIHALLHGHFGDAFGSNMLLVIFIPFFLYCFISFLWNSWHSRKIERKILHSPVFAWSCFAVIVLFGILRNLPFAAFSWMAP